MPGHVLFDWDYGYELPLRGLRDPERLLSADLLVDLRAWLHAFELGNPSDPKHPSPGMLADARQLSERVRVELAPRFHVDFGLDVEPRRRGLRAPDLTADPT